MASFLAPAYVLVHHIQDFFSAATGDFHHVDDESVVMLGGADLKGEQFAIHTPALGNGPPCVGGIVHAALLAEWGRILANCQAPKPAPRLAAGGRLRKSNNEAAFGNTVEWLVVSTTRHSTVEARASGCNSRNCGASHYRSTDELGILQENCWNGQFGRLRGKKENRAHWHCHVVQDAL
jgi:hypothetical protein